MLNLVSLNKKREKMKKIEEKISQFKVNYQNAINNMLDEYASVNKNNNPIISPNGFIVAPCDNYKIPPLKFVVGLPMSFEKGERLPFISIKEDKYNYYINKVTDKDLKVFEKSKIKLQTYNKIMDLLGNENLAFHVEIGNTWFEFENEFCYIYIKGCISTRAKKEFIKFCLKIDKELDKLNIGDDKNIPIEISKKKGKKIKKVLDPNIEKNILIGKRAITATLKDYEIEERRVSDVKIEKRYVGIFKSETGDLTKGTIAKKLIDEVKGEVDSLIGKKVKFTAVFKMYGKKDHILFSNPIKASLI